MHNVTKTSYYKHILYFEILNTDSLQITVYLKVHEDLGMD